jgi:hypothetical protein
LLTHDFDSMLGFAYDRIRALQTMPGVVAVPQRTQLRAAIEGIELLIYASDELELNAQVKYVPLR